MSQSPKRFLYDQDFIKAGCPSDRYNAETNVDNSVWTFTTCYAIAAVGITLSILLLAMSSTSASSSSFSEQGKTSSPAKSQRTKERQKKGEKAAKSIEQPQQNSSLGQKSVSAGQYSWQELCAASGDEPSMKSWRSLEESFVSQYLEDGTISTNPKDGDKETSTNPATGRAIVTNPPVAHSLSSWPRRSTQISLGSAPPQIFRAPSTAVNSAPESDSAKNSINPPHHAHQKGNSYDDYYMTLLVCYFCFQSISYLVAGFGHMTGQDFSGKMPSRTVHGTAALGACSLVAVAASEYTRLLYPRRRSDEETQSQQRQSDGSGDESLNNSGRKTLVWTVIWILCSLPTVIVFVLLDSELYTKIFLGGSHFAVFLTALFRVCFGESKQKINIYWYFIDAAAMLLYVGGLALQAYFEELCGYDGYKDDCFASCPFSSSPEALNHNSIFHLCVLTSILMFGCSKMVQMKPVLPAPAGRNSGPAEAALQQDNTIEV